MTKNPKQTSSDFHDLENIRVAHIFIVPHSPFSPIPVTLANAGLIRNNSS